MFDWEIKDSVFFEEIVTNFLFEPLGLVHFAILLVVVTIDLYQSQLYTKNYDKKKEKRTKIHLGLILQ